MRCSLALVLLWGCPGSRTEEPATVAQSAASGGSETAEPAEPEDSQVESLIEPSEPSEPSEASDVPAACAPGPPWRRTEGEWRLEPEVGFEIDSPELTRASMRTLESALELLPEGQRVQVFVDTHPDVMARFAVRGRHLPRARAQAILQALGGPPAESRVREREDERTNGPPTIRFVFPDCPAR